MSPSYFLLILIFGLFCANVKSTGGKGDSAKGNGDNAKSESAKDNLLIKPPYYKRMAFVKDGHCYFTTDMKHAYLVESRSDDKFLYFWHRIVYLEDPEDPLSVVQNETALEDDDDWHLIKTVCRVSGGLRSMPFPPKKGTKRELIGAAIPPVPGFKTNESDKLKQLPAKYIEALKAEFEKRKIALEIQNFAKALLKPETFNMDLVKDFPKSGKISRMDLIKHLKPIAAEYPTIQVQYGDKDGSLWKMLILYLFGSNFAYDNGFSFSMQGYNPPAEKASIIKPKDVSIQKIKLKADHDRSVDDVLREMEKDSVLAQFKAKIADMVKSMDDYVRDNKKYTLNVQLVCGADGGSYGTINMTCFKFMKRSDQEDKAEEGNGYDNAY